MVDLNRFTNDELYAYCLELQCHDHLDKELMACANEVLKRLSISIDDIDQARMVYTVHPIIETMCFSYCNLFSSWIQLVTTMSTPNDKQCKSITQPESILTYCLDALKAIESIQYMCEYVFPLLASKDYQ